jgi:hypothetical protein
MDRQDRSEIGHIDDLRADAWLRIIWKSGRHECVHERMVMQAPGFIPKLRHEPTRHPPSMLRFMSPFPTLISCRDG